MSIKISNIIDDHVICYLPFDTNDIAKNYGLKSEKLDIESRQNILDSNVPNSNFIESRSMTTSNIENNDFYKITWNFTQEVFSIEFWFNFIKTGKKDDWFFRIYLQDDNSINVYRHILSDSTYYISLSETNEFTNDTVLTENTWYHFCLERDIENQKLSFYINGVLQNSSQYTNTDQIREMMFYTGWGNDYRWQCIYNNIIISDIIRYNHSSFTPPINMIPAFKYIYTKSNTKRCLSKEISNENQKVNRKILKNIRIEMPCCKKPFEDHVICYFDTLYNFIKDDLGDILFDIRSNKVITVKSYSNLKRLPITNKVRKYAFVFSLDNN